MRGSRATASSVATTSSPTGLAARLGDRVRLDTAVAIVEPDDGAVVLRSGERLTADHLVATVPLPVLGRMWNDIPPELSRPGYGIGGKVSVQFGRRVWLDYGRDGSVRTERAWGELWETTDGQAGDAGVMTALLSSNDGAALMSLPDIGDRVVAEIERIFPGSKGLAREQVITDWTDDEFALGAYVTFGLGQLLPAWPLLRRPSRSHAARRRAHRRVVRLHGGRPPQRRPRRPHHPRRRRGVTTRVARLDSWRRVSTDRGCRSCGRHGSGCGD